MTQGSGVGGGLLWCLLTCLWPTFANCLVSRLLWRLISNADVLFVCNWQTEYYYEYTECDSTGSRWRVAIPQNPGACTGLPEPVRGTECSKFTLCVCLRMNICIVLSEQNTVSHNWPLLNHWWGHVGAHIYGCNVWWYMLVLLQHLSK